MAQLLIRKPAFYVHVLNDILGYCLHYELAIGERSLISDSVPDTAFGYSLSAFWIDAAALDSDGAIRIDGDLKRFSLTPQAHVIVLDAYPKGRYGMFAPDLHFTDTSDAIEWISENVEGLWSMTPAILPDRIAPAFSFSDERESLAFKLTFG